jgi:hypothetical protein
MSVVNHDIFKAVYAKNLEVAVTKWPQEYSWPATELGAVVGRVNTAIDKKAFNKDSRAFKMTCEELGIKHTYKAIYAYLDAP